MKIKAELRFPHEPMINRYVRRVSSDNRHVWFVDRVTGQEVMGYDTREIPPSLANEPKLLAERGLDIGERVLIKRCKIKPEGREMISYALQEVLRQERLDELRRGEDLLVEEDFWTFLGLDVTELNFSVMETVELRLLDALQAKGFTGCVCFTDQAGLRGVRAIRGDKSHIFYYA